MKGSMVCKVPSTARCANLIAEPHSDNATSRAVRRALTGYPKPLIATFGSDPSMFDPPTQHYPKKWKEMSLDFKLMFVYHVSMMLLFIAGGSLSIQQEIMQQNKFVTWMHRAQRGKYHKRISIGVARAEVIQVDLILAAEQRHPVFKGSLRNEFRLVTLEDIHFQHVRFCVFLRHDIDGRRKFRVASGVIGMRVRVDDHRHRFAGDRFHLVQNRLAVARVLGIDQNDTLLGDEHAERPSRAEPEDVAHQLAPGPEQERVDEADGRVDDEHIRLGVPRVGEHWPAWHQRRAQGLGREGRT